MRQNYKLVNRKNILVINMAIVKSSMSGVMPRKDMVKRIMTVDDSIKQKM